MYYSSIPRYAQEKYKRGCAGGRRDRRRYGQSGCPCFRRRCQASGDPGLNFKLVAVISPEKDAYAMKRALNAGVPAYVVDPELFPTMTSYSMAIANKLKDMDIELVILAGYELPLGVVPYQYKNRIIGTCPSIYPAFEDVEGDLCRAALERGVKVTGATAYFADGDGRVGNIILQKAVDIYHDDTPESLRRRVMEEGEWKLLSRAVALYCAGKLVVHGNRVLIRK